MYRTGLAAFLAVICSFLGCAKTDSTNVKTSGIQADFRIEVSSTNGVESVRARATFKVGGSTGTYVDLTGGDTIICNSESLIRTELLGMVDYSRALAYQPSGVYAFTFSRPGEPPYTASVTIPDVVTISSPVPGNTLRKGQDLAVAWVPGGHPSDSVTVQLATRDSNDTDYYSPSLPDSGTATVPAGYTKGSLGSKGAPIPATLTVTRARAGTQPAGLGGSTTATTSQSVSLTLSD